MTRLGMLIDLAYCIGCNACTVACKQEQGTPPGVMYARVLVREFGKYPRAGKIFLPILCMHCEHPPCMKVCPSGAITRTEDGVVLINEEICSGAQACVTACPYGAIFYPDTLHTYFETPTPFEEYHIQRRRKFPTAMKCNLCIQRVRDGKDPACVVTCPTDCRIFGDWDDPESKINKYLRERRPVAEPFPLRPDAGTRPKVMYLPDTYAVKRVRWEVELAAERGGAV